MQFQSARLEITSPFGVTTTHELTETPMIVGRKTATHVPHVALEDEQRWVSRHHLYLDYVGDRWYCADASSTNGSLLRRRRPDGSLVHRRVHRREQLQHRDEILILGRQSDDPAQRYWVLRYLAPAEHQVTDDPPQVEGTIRQGLPDPTPADDPGDVARGPSTSIDLDRDEVLRSRPIDEVGSDRPYLLYRTVSKRMLVVTPAGETDITDDLQPLQFQFLHHMTMKAEQSAEPYPAGAEKAEIAEAVWGFGPDRSWSNSFHVLLSRLRDLIEPVRETPSIIVTMPGGRYVVWSRVEEDDWSVPPE